MQKIAKLSQRALNWALIPLGVQVNRYRESAPPSTPENSLAASLSRLKNAGIAINTIIDIGASDGRWSRIARNFFPDSAILAFEPLHERWPAWDQWRSSDPRVHLVRGAAGAANGMTQFYVADDLDGSGITSDGEGGREVALASIDDEVAASGLFGPFLIKLDTHGFEVPILEGASTTLKNTAVLIIEVYNFKLTNNSLTFQEMCQYLGALGFRCYDVMDILRRPGDDALWQMDFVFLPENHAVFTTTKYR